jgi:hypothetical protein
MGRSGYWATFVVQQAKDVLAFLTRESRLPGRGNNANTSEVLCAVAEGCPQQLMHRLLRCPTGSRPQHQPSECWVYCRKSQHFCVVGCKTEKWHHSSLNPLRRVTTPRIGLVHGPAPQPCEPICSVLAFTGCCALNTLIPTNLTMCCRRKRSLHAAYLRCAVNADWLLTSLPPTRFRSKTEMKETAQTHECHQKNNRTNSLQYAELHAHVFEG